MTHKDSFGLWATRVEGGEWYSLDERQLESVCEKAAAIGIRINGKDAVYDFVFRDWRQNKQQLPDVWGGDCPMWTIT